MTLRSALAYVVEASGEPSDTAEFDELVAAAEAYRAEEQALLDERAAIEQTERDGGELRELYAWETEVWA